MYYWGKPLIPFSTIFSYLYQVDVKTINIYTHHTFSFHNFLFLTSNVEKIILSPVIVKNEDGTIIPLEKLVKVLPKSKEIRIFDDPIFSRFTKNTVKELTEIPHLRTIDKFDLYNITEKFDIETFFTYLKKNKHTKFELFFADIILKGYKNRVEKIIDEIIVTPNHDYKIPHSYFDGIDESKYSKMHSLSRQL